MNITNCVYSLYVSFNLALPSHCSGQCCCVLPRRWAGVHEVSHLRNCSSTTLLYMFLRPSLSQSQSADCCNAVSCSAAWHSGDVSRPGWVTILTTGHGTEVMMMIHKYALLSGCLRHFLVSWLFRTLTFFAHDKVASGAVQCSVWPGPGCSAGPLNGTCESNVDWEESWNFVTLQISIPRILDGYQCRCHQQPATMHHQSQSPHLTLKYWTFQSHTARDDEMKTSGAKVSLFQILFPADHLIIITNYRLPWKWNWMSLAHNNTLLGI